MNVVFLIRISRKENANLFYLKCGTEYLSDIYTTPVSQIRYRRGPLLKSCAQWRGRSSGAAQVQALRTSGLTKRGKGSDPLIRSDYKGSG